MYLGSAKDTTTGSFDDPTKPYTVSITGHNKIAPSAQPLLAVGAMLLVLLMLKGKK